MQAYAHNDYNNQNPLYDAVTMGFRGVEVDVFLVDGVLRVGHSRRQAKKGPRLDSLYLEPIRDMVYRCNREAAVRPAIVEPFLLNVEVKERSVETLAALYPLILAMDEVLGVVGRPSSSLKVNAMLVGYSGAEEGAALSYQELGVSCKLEKLDLLRACLSDSRVRMLSIDYGKTMGRWYTLEIQRERWMRAIRAIAVTEPDKILRVYNVPENREVYRELLQSSVDIIGTKNLARTAELLPKAVSGAKPRHR
ncbi:MAG: hypothetical protein ACO1Q7_17000 [Gemmatimonas sp.]